MIIIEDKSVLMNNMNQQRFKVKVTCMTYNQASFIEETMVGFCMQNTSFPFICTIFDDNSIDGEQDVIRQYLKANFNLMDKSVVRNEETDDYVLTFAQHKENKNCYFAVYYLKYNHYSVRKGNDIKNDYCCNLQDHVPFIAICEGDDYWTDPNKLQKQVDYLESHLECGMVYTQAQQYFQETGEFKPGWAAQTDFEDLLMNSNKIMTLTSCFRSDLFKKYRAEIIADKNWKMGDYPLWLYISKNSKVHFLNEITGIYRVLSSSASHTSDLKKMTAFMLSVYDIRCFFANRYGYQNRIKGLAHDVINDLFRLSVQKDKYLSITIFKFAKRNGVLSSNVFFKCIFYSTKLGRGYHRRKYPDSATMY
jgi:hypothetical protein